MARHHLQAARQSFVIFRQLAGYSRHVPGDDAVFKCGVLQAHLSVTKFRAGLKTPARFYFAVLAGSIEFMARE